MVSEVGKISSTSGRRTWYGPSLRSRIKSAATLTNSLSAGSKRRFYEYQSDVNVSRGLQTDNFDGHMKDLILKYAYNPKEIRREIRYLDHIYDDDGHKFSRNLQLYSKTEEAMIRFSSPDYPSLRWNANYQASLKELKDIFKKFKLKPIQYRSDDDIKDVLPKARSHSGYFYISNGVRYKGDCVEGSLHLLEETENRAISEGSFNIPVLMGFRTQGSGEYDDDGSKTYTCKHKTRVIAMVDFLWAVSEFRFMKPLQKRVALEPFYSGGKNDFDISALISHWRTKYSNFLSLDYSSYDQTISGWLLEDAYDVMKEAFILDERQSKLFDVLKHDAVHKDFIVAEGIIHSDRGMLSGLPATQLGDSIINVLIAMTYFKSIGQKFEMTAMGDDDLMFTNAQISLREFADYVRKNFGMIVNTDDKSCEGSTKQDPKYLSRYWTRGGPRRNKYQVLSRMLFPERFRKYDNDVTPELVLYAYLLTYPRGVDQLIDVNKFKRDHPNLNKVDVWNRVDSHYVPGILAYNREYLSDKVA